MRTLELPQIETDGKSEKQIAAAVKKAPSFQEHMAKLAPDAEPGEFALVDGVLYLFHPNAELRGEPDDDQPAYGPAWVRVSYTVPG